MKKVDIKRIVDTYSKKGCNITAACIGLGITRKTFYTWREKYPKLKEQLEEAEESILDNAESKLLSHINEGDTTCLIFFLKTKGRKRGYVEKVETEHSLNPFLELMMAATSEE